MHWRIAVLAGLVALPATLAAQHDYRNLDHGRPVASEDAYPVEQGAFELMLPLASEWHDGATGVMLEPEVMWGFVRNGMVGLGGPIRLGDGGGLAGLRPFAFYNFNTELPALPALAMRIDATMPVGALGGEATTVTATAIATRSFGVWRAHVNAGVTVGNATDAPRDDAPSRWSAAIGVDRTFWRQGAVVIAEVQVSEGLDGGTAWRGGAGIRMQLTPLLVLDIGAARRLFAHGPDLMLTAGVTRAFSLAGGVE